MTGKPRILPAPGPEWHSDTVGGSNAERRLNCSASFNLESGQADRDTVYNKEGTALHSAVSHYFTQLDGEPYAALRGLKFGGFDITNDRLEGKLRPALRAFDDLCDEHELDNLLVEERTNGDYGIPGSGGTIDALAYGDSTVAVVDFKFGFHKVEDLTQQRLYALCGLTDPQLKDVFRDRKILVVVIQPEKGRKARVQVEVTDLKELNRLADGLVESYNEAINGGGKAVKGSWCQWCKAKSICPEWKEESDGKALLQLPDGMDVETCSNEDLSRINKQAKDLAERTQALIDRKVWDGETIPGWKMVEKMSQRQYTDPAAVELILIKRLGKKGAFKHKLLSPAQAEEVLGERVYTRALAPLVTSEATGYSVVRESDRRKAAHRLDSEPVNIDLDQGGE